MAWSEVARVIQGLTAGIGFLGVGAILKWHEAHEVHGLTTAAGLWMTAAIGVATGLGRLGTALLGALLTWVCSRCPRSSRKAARPTSNRHSARPRACACQVAALDNGPEEAAQGAEAGAAVARCEARPRGPTAQQAAPMPPLSWHGPPRAVGGAARVARWGGNGRGTGPGGRDEAGCLTWQTRAHRRASPIHPAITRAGVRRARAGGGHTGGLGGRSLHGRRRAWPDRAGAAVLGGPRGASRAGVARLTPRGGSTRAVGPGAGGGARPGTRGHGAGPVGRPASHAARRASWSAWGVSSWRTRRQCQRRRRGTGTRQAAACGACGPGPAGLACAAAG